MNVVRANIFLRTVCQKLQMESATSRTRSARLQMQSATSWMRSARLQMESATSRMRSQEVTGGVLGRTIV